MAKKGMNIKYKSRKRERNKYNPAKDDSAVSKSSISVVVGVLIFLVLMYLAALGLGKMGLFEAGYKPTEKETTIDYEYIPIGTVFNRSEKTYFVLFDDYSTKISFDMYVDQLVSNSKIKTYKVDMSTKANAKYKGETPNKKASRATELSINDITLIKITNGKIKDYIVGSENIEKYLK